MKIARYSMRMMVAVGAVLSLTACVGEPGDASSATSISSAPASSMSSVASSAPSSQVSLIGDSVRGKELYEGSAYSCINCHGKTGQSPLPVFPNIDPSKSELLHKTTGSRIWSLADYITAFMPAPDKCDAQCGADIASYIATWLDSGSNSSSDNPAEVCEVDSVSYGRRQLRLLSRAELTQTLKDLTGYSLQPVDLGVPDDAVVEGFVNHTRSFVTQAHYDSYIAAAEAAAKYAESKNFAGIIDCSGKNLAQCADAFTANYASKVFRRPLTNQERNRYSSIITAAGDTKAGLKFALNAILSSPNFLYRSELGVDVATIRTQIDAVNRERRQPAQPTPSQGRTILATLEGASLGLNGNEAKRINQNQTYGKNVKSVFPFSNNNIIIVRAKGAKLGGQWPTLELTIDGTSIGKVEINKDTFAQYTFRVRNLNVNAGFLKVKNIRGSGSQAKNRYIEFTSIKFGKLGGTTTTGPANTTIVAKPPSNIDSDAYVLSQYELATFLAYTFTGSTPDNALLNAAKNWALDTPENIQKQIKRLLNTEKAKNHFANFGAQWLHTDNILDVSKDTDLYPDFTPEIRTAMAREIREIFKTVIFDGNQPITSIFNDFSFLNKSLADYYGVSGPTNNNFVRVNDLGTRGGVLASGAFMAGLAGLDESSPIKRAVSVRENLLCQPLPPMPTDIDSARDDAENALQNFIDSQGGAITNKQNFHFLTKDAPCSDCHREFINPLGFGMEDFDAAGRPRTKDLNNLNIDLMGELIGTETLTDGNVKAFEGTMGLSKILEQSTQVPRCFVQKGFRSVMGVGHKYYDHIAEDAPELSDAEKAGYACVISKMSGAMESKNMNAKAAFEALGISDIVRYRKLY